MGRGDQIDFEITFNNGETRNRLDSDSFEHSSFHDYEEELIPVSSPPPVYGGAPPPTLLGFILRTLEFLGVLVVSCVTMWILLLPYCDVLFLCGCTWHWQGGVDSCNINDPDSPSCPWCTLPTWGVRVTQLIMILSMIIGYYSVYFLSRQWRKKTFEATSSQEYIPIAEMESAIESSTSMSSKEASRWLAWTTVVRVCCQIAVWLLFFFASGFVIAVILKITSGYPYFLINNS